MRFFMRAVCAVVIVLFAVAPATAQVAHTPGHKELEGVVVMSDSGMALLTDVGSFSQDQMPLVAQTPEIEAQLKKVLVAERDYGNMYEDATRVKISGNLEIVDRRYRFTVEKLVLPNGGASASAVARIEAFEQIAVGVRGLSDAGDAKAKDIANQTVMAASVLLNEVTDTPQKSRVLRVLRSLEGIAIGQKP